jgi:hypothetical protein
MSPTSRPLTRVAERLPAAPTIPLADNNPSMTLADAQQQRLLERLRWTSYLAHVSVSVVPPAVSSSGVVRPGERRSPACRCSRGHRPTGSDSEATDHLATPPQRHPSEVDDRSTQTPLPHDRRLQKPYSPPDCSCQPRIVASIICHNDQSPIPPPTICSTVLAADRGLDLRAPPSGIPGGLAVARIRVLVFVDRGSLFADVPCGRVASRRSLSKPYELIVFFLPT